MTTKGAEMSKDLLVLADEYAVATATFAREAGGKRAVLAEALSALYTVQPEPVNAMLVDALKALLSWVDAYAETSDAEFPDIEAKAEAALTAAKQAQPLSAGHADATLLKLYASAGASPVEPNQARELSEALENLIDATEGLMAWQVKNVKVWNNPAYDTAHMRIEQLRAAINAKGR